MHEINDISLCADCRATAKNGTNRKRSFCCCAVPIASANHSFSKPIACVFPIMPPPLLLLPPSKTTTTTTHLLVKRSMNICHLPWQVRFWSSTSVEAHRIASAAATTVVAANNTQICTQMLHKMKSNRND